jgi:hypothetical protein
MLEARNAAEAMTTLSVRERKCRNVARGAIAVTVGPQC